MQYKKTSTGYIVRIDKGEELVQSLRDFCTKENVTLASIRGIGATNNVTLGFFDPQTKDYSTQNFKENFEITALIGNITTMNDEVYLHLHITLGDKDFNARGGHLQDAIISATCEIIIHTLDGTVDRFKDENVGLNLLKI